jgi:F-type H+-transporting ATPase subunit a
MHIEVSIAPETLFHIGPVPITNSMLTMFIVMAAILIVGSWIARKAQVVPGRAQGLAEMIIEFLLGLVEGTAGKRVGRRIFPLVGALFIFILFANYSGLFPGIGTIGYKKEVPVAEGESASLEVASIGAVPDRSAVARADEQTEEVLVPFFRSPNADLNMTLALALVTFTVVQIAGIRAHGVVGRIKHMADPWWIFPLEVIQEFARIISLSFRLFGNVFAGEILLALMYAIARAIRLAIIPFIFPVAFLFLEVLFGTIQALVFALLTLIYITLATAGGHDTEEHAHEHETVATGAQPVPAGGGD